MRGYEALREHAAWLDLSARGRIRVTGEDRVRLLHAMSTNHIQQLKAGEGCYAFFLNPQGHILADARVLVRDDHILLDTESETRVSLREHLDKYIIADDVTLEDVAEETVEIGVEGPASADILARLDAPVPVAPYSSERWGETLVARATVTGGDGFALIGTRRDLADQLTAAGLPPVSAEEARIVRLELGHPRYTEDISDRHLPHETQMLDAVHFSKGCYIGQEIVERIRSRGGVHRLLVPLEVEGDAPAEPGTAVTNGPKAVGEITSSACSPALGKVVALAYLRLDEIPEGAALTAGSRPVHIRARKPR